MRLASLSPLRGITSLTLELISLTLFLSVPACCILIFG